MGIVKFIKSLLCKQEGSRSSLSEASQSYITSTDELVCGTNECCEEVYQSMISDILNLPQGSDKAILAIIKNSDGGFQSWHDYQDKIWEQFFRDADWAWLEYEEWYQRFESMGKFPLKFPARIDVNLLANDAVLSHLKVVELKAMCSDYQINALSKLNKTQLIDILKTNEKIKDHPLVVQKLSEVDRKFKHNLFSLFMTTMKFRGTSLFNYRRAQAAGFKAYKVLHVFDEDREFVELALKLNPNALHPLFPSDLSMKQPVRSFDKEG